MPTDSPRHRLSVIQQVAMAIRFLKSLVGGKTTALIKQANELIPMARVHAVGSYHVISDSHPALKKIDQKWWEFVVTTAGTFIAMSRLGSLKLNVKQSNLVADIVSAQLVEWDSRGPRAFDDCQAFVDKNIDILTAAGHEARFVASDALGLWIVWNVFGKDSGMDDERQLVRSIGGLTVQAFFDWWGKKPLNKQLFL